MSAGETTEFGATGQLPNLVPEETTAAQDAARDIVRQGLVEQREQNLAQVRDIITSPFDGEVPDAIFAHSGGMAYRPEPALQKYMTTSYAEDQLTEHGQATGGRLRIIATTAIAEAIPDVPIITNSFMDGHPEAPTMAEVAKKELVGRGVDESRIIKEESSFTTITQHREMIKMAVANDWRNLSIVVNAFHVPRVQAFLDRLDTLTEAGLDDSLFQQTLAQFKEMGGRVSITAAESVIRSLDPRFGEYFGRVALSEGYQYTVAMEAKGLADLEAGRYNARLTPKTPPVK